MTSKFASAPSWTREQLDLERHKAEELFKTQRREEGPRAFVAAYENLEPEVRRALSATGNLLELTGQVFKDDPHLFQILRNFCGPPISEEDLWTLVGGPKFKRVPPDYAQETADVISLVIDPVRFPWVAERRDPTGAELDKAILATTVLLTSRLIGTNRRGSASVRQEGEVTSLLSQNDFVMDPARDSIDVLDHLARGNFSKERKVAGAKCDVPIRLRDGRLLAVECKVSNGPKNGWKRVIREVGGKSETWRKSFGKQVVTAVVLAGVFDLSCLLQAQNDYDVFLFWEHDLAPLAEFVSPS